MKCKLTESDRSLSTYISSVGIVHTALIIPRFAKFCIRFSVNQDGSAELALISNSTYMTRQNPLLSSYLFIGKETSL